MTKARDISSRNGSTLIIPSSVSVGSGSGSVSANGTVTISSASSITFNNIFSATYDSYAIYALNLVGGGVSGLVLTFPGVTSGYYSGQIYTLYTSGTPAGYAQSNASNSDIGIVVRTVIGSSGILNIMSPYLSAPTLFSCLGSDVRISGGAGARITNGFVDTTSSYTGCTLSTASGTTMSGQFRIYGMNNG